MLLQTIPNQYQKNNYIAYVSNLERSFRIGFYNQIDQLSKNPPLKEMNVFLKRVNETIRYSMARSAEVAYDYLKIDGAFDLFHLRNLEDLKSFINEQREKGRENG